jgi:DNA-nicking Smr family endonuclease
MLRAASMPRRRRQKSQPAPKPAADAGSFHSPFRDLARTVRRTAAPVAARPRTPASAPPAPAPAAPVEDDAESFRRAMADVQPLARGSRVDAPAPALHLKRAPVSDEAEALAALSDLVGGTGGFDISDSFEYVEGAVVGLDPRILRRLRRGEFAYQAYLDLHGMTIATAREAVQRFVADAVRAGHRCLLIIHGRGLRSKDQIPVLKERVTSWLARGGIGRHVLAFTSARPADGGAGAVYVLLRRRRGTREPIEVYEGAKRE